jgi:type I restriction enzyme S subunit
MLAPYPNYAPSGLPWAPQIPEGWQVQRNGRLFSHRVETGYPDLPILEVSLRTGVRVRDMERGKRKQVMSAKEKYKRAVKGDIAYNMMRMWQGAVGPAPTDGLVSPAYVVVRPHAGVNTAYYSYLFRTAAYMQEVNKFSRGIVADRNRLYWESFKQMPSMVPPKGDQDQIVAFLQVQDIHIGRFITSKLAQIELLREQKRRILDHFVTQGVDPQVRLTGSGVDWLGDVPSHWETVFVKHVSAVRASGVDKHSHPHELPVRLCNHSDVYANDQIVAELDLMSATASASEIARFTLRAGDVILTKDSVNPAVIGIPAWVPKDLGGVVCAYHLTLLRPKTERVTGEFLFRVLESPRVADRFPMLATGVTIVGLSSHDIKNTCIPLPPMEEQIAICKAISEACEPIQDAIDKAVGQIELVREFRDRQIADVVSGKVDVRGWQPSHGDCITEEDLTALGDDDDNDTTEEETDGDDGHD